MADVLFIKANDRPADQAISVQMYETFLKTYKEVNPDDTITELDLFAAELPYYGNTAITGMYKQGQGLALTGEEKKSVDLIESYLEQFFQAEKVVFAFPLWNATVPAPLVTYISYLAQAGRTFKYTAEGPIGLAGDKKVVLLSSRGSDYSLEQMTAAEMAVAYVRINLRLWGIKNPLEVIIEGHNQYPDRASSIVEEGLRRTALAAGKF